MRPGGGGAGSAQPRGMVAAAVPGYTDPSSTYTISGTVTTDGVTTVGGGMVELYNGAGLLLSYTSINGSGAYSFTGIQPGSYYVMNHPPPAYCVKVGDEGYNSTVYSDQVAVTITNANVTNADFLVQTVQFWDDFSSYASISAVLDATNGVWGSWHWSGGGGSSASFSTYSSLSNDGPSGEQVLNYHWPASPTDSEVNLIGYNNSHNFSDGLWVQTYTWEGRDGGSGNFETGTSAIEYKWCLIWRKRNSSGSADRSCHTELQYGPTSYRFRGIMDDGTHTLDTAQTSHGCDYPPSTDPCGYNFTGSAFFRDWHLTTVQTGGWKTASGFMKLYMDRTQLWGLTGNDSGDVSYQVGLWQIGGANLNGPNATNAQTRRHRLWQISDGRPGMRTDAIIV